MTTPADELTAAVRRLRSGTLITRVDLDMPLALLLEGVLSQARESGHEVCASWCSPDTCDLSAAVAVARLINAAPSA
ncbi:hypothetical protein [Streptomyces prasinus]|uniref:hypothetical protein n=1 Tax=Streptomyces prasinus TaxID=67345 RepID=UPI003687B26D